MPAPLSYPIRGDRLRMSTQVDQVLADIQSPYQRIEIIETPSLGRMLLLDGHVQLATVDEHAYHEALVHVPLFGLEAPRRALVVGGGDGGVLRELCRWPSMQEIEMVEIDSEVIRASREHLPSLSAGAFDDPRVSLTEGDAFEYVQNAVPGYDLIVADATDVYEEEDHSLSERLFGVDFYRQLASLLSPDGVVVTQADNLLFCPYSLEGILHEFSQVFPARGSYWAVVPSFGGLSGFAWGSLGRVPSAEWPGQAPEGLRYLSTAMLAAAHDPLPF